MPRPHQSLMWVSILVHQLQSRLALSCVSWAELSCNLCAVVQCTINTRWSVHSNQKSKYMFTPSTNTQRAEGGWRGAGELFLGLRMEPQQLINAPYTSLGRRRQVLPRSSWRYPWLSLLSSPLFYLVFRWLLHTIFCLLSCMFLRHPSEYGFNFYRVQAQPQLGFLFLISMLPWSGLCPTWLAALAQTLLHSFIAVFCGRGKNLLLVFYAAARLILVSWLKVLCNVSYSPARIKDDPTISPWVELCCLNGLIWATHSHLNHEEYT